jgi:hypothetical protein
MLALVSHHLLQFKYLFLLIMQADIIIDDLGMELLHILLFVDQFALTLVELQGSDNTVSGKRFIGIELLLLRLWILSRILLPLTNRFRQNYRPHLRIAFRHCMLQPKDPLIKPQDLPVCRRTLRKSVDHRPCVPGMVKK